MCSALANVRLVPIADINADELVSDAALSIEGGVTQPRSQPQQLNLSVI